jgi:YbbR domain-containing protein
MDLREPGRQYYYFDPSDIGMTGSLHVVSIEPASVPLVWRPRAERTVPVHANLSGSPAAGYVVKSPLLISPAAVTVSGPRDEIEAISYWTTEQIGIDGLGPGVTERRVRLEPLTGHLTFAAQSIVTVRIEVESDIAERTFSGLEVEAVGSGSVKLRPTAVQVTLRGPAPQLAKLSGDQLVPFVEPSGASPSSVESAVVKLGGLPEFCSIVRIVPSSVLVRHER